MKHQVYTPLDTKAVAFLLSASIYASMTVFSAALIKLLGSSILVIIIATVIMFTTFLLSVSIYLIIAKIGEEIVIPPKNNSDFNFQKGSACYNLQQRLSDESRE